MTSYRYLPTINTLRLSPEDTQLLLEAVACQGGLGADRALVTERTSQFSLWRDGRWTN